VVKWLTNGPYRRFVLSFSSAPTWDGGAGVTYVLLRRRPVKRRRKKTGGKA
jgi:DNA-nicking Smr family endonuclease